MKTKYQINEKVETPEGPGIIQEIEPAFGEYKVRLEDGADVYVYEEDLKQTSGNRGEGVT